LTKTCKILVVSIVIYSVISGLVSAEAIVENVYVNPENPTKLSDVTITTSFAGINESDNITLYIKECDENTGLCDQPFSMLMTGTNSNNFSADFSLEFETATYFDYWFVVERNGGTTDIKDDSYNVQMASSSGDDNDPQNGGDSKAVPGLEMTIFLVAIFIGLIYLRKRDRK